jgi:hypothetical protein
MGQLAATVLQLNPSCRQPREVQPVTSCPVGFTKGLFHEAIHPSLAFMFTVGEHRKASGQFGHRFDVVAIHLAGQGILHQIHADAVEVLND